MWKLCSKSYIRHSVKKCILKNEYQVLDICPGDFGLFLQAFGLGLNNIGEVLEAIGGGHNVIKLVSNNVMHEASLFLV